MIERRWLILAVLFVARTALGFQFQSIGSTAPVLMQELRVGYGEIGTLIGLYMLPGVLVALPGGLLSARFRDARICSAGLLLMALGGILQGFADGYGAAVAAGTQPLSAVWVLPGIGLFVIAVNAVLALGVHHRARVGAVFLAAGAVVVQILVGLSLARIGAS